MELYAARKITHNESIEILEKKLKRLWVQSDAAKENLNLIEREKNIVEPLVKQGVEAEMELIRIKQRMNEAESNILQVEAEIEANNAQLKAEKSNFVEQAREKLQEVEKEYNNLVESLPAYEDRLDRTLVRAPMNAIVNRLLVNTVGGVIQAGETLVDIVPVDDKLIIESKLPVEDIGYIQIGQEALVHLSGPSLSRYKPIVGKVIGVSPDAIIPEEPNTEAYYEIKIQTDQTYFSKGNERYEMFPGTQVVAGIRVGRRTLYEYITEPIFGNLNNALSEQ